MKSRLLAVLPILLFLVAPALAQDGPPEHLKAGESVAGQLSRAKFLPVERQDDGSFRAFDPEEIPEDARPMHFLVPDSTALAFVWSNEPCVLRIPFTLDAPEGEKGCIVVLLGHTELRPAGSGVYSWPEVWDLPTGPSGVASGLIFHGGQVAPEAFDETGVSAVIGAEPGLGIASTRIDGNSINRLSEEAPFKDCWTSTTIRFGPETPRGACTLWFTLAPSSLWPHHGRFCTDGLREAPDSVSVTFHAKLWQIRRATGASRDDVQTALGYRVDPDRNLSLWKRLPDVEIPVESRRNGWVIDESRAMRALAEDYRPPDYVKEENRATGSGGTFSSLRQMSRTDMEGVRQVDYKVVFPASIPDWSVFEMSVSGNSAATGEMGPYSWSVRISNPMSFSNDLDWPEEWLETEPPGNFFWLTQPVPAPQNGPPSATAEDNRKKFLEKYAGGLKTRLPAHKRWPADRETGHREGKWTVFSLAPGDQFSGMGKGGPRPLFEVKMSAGGHGGQAYRRLSNVESSAAGATRPAAATPSGKHKPDGYWRWYANKLCPALYRMYEILDETNGVATAAGLTIRASDKQARILLDAYNTDCEVASDSVRIRMIRQVKELRKDILAARADLDRVVPEAEATVDTVLTLLAEQADRSRRAERSRPDLLRWKKRFTREKTLVAPRMYMTGGAPDRFKEAMAERDSELLGPETRLEMATLYRDQREPVRALLAYRTVTRIDPDSRQGRTARREAAALEGALLKAISRKVSGEVEAARRKFFDAMDSRGAYGKERSTAGDGFWHLWLIFSTGPGASLSAIYGRTDAQEEELSAQTGHGVLAYLGLKAMAELASGGTSLEEIAAGLSSKQLSERLPLKKVGGREYGKEDYAALGSAIRQALALTPVRDLLSENVENFELSLADTVLDDDIVHPCETISDRCEYSFDLLSAKNMLMFLLPHSVGSIGGKILPYSFRCWGVTSEGYRAIRVAEAAGKSIRTGQEVIAVAIGWQRALVAIRGTRWIKGLARQLEGIHKSGGFVWKATWGASPFLADLALVTGVVHVAERFGGPEVAAAVDALLSTFLFDPDLCASLLKRSGTTLEQLKNVAGRFSKGVSRYEDDFRKASKRMNVLEDSLREKKPLDTGIEWVDDGPEFKEFIPGPDRLLNQRYVEARVVNRFKISELDEAQDAAHAGQEMLGAARSQLDELLEKNEALRRLIQKLDPDKAFNAKVPDEVQGAVSLKIGNPEYWDTPVQKLIGEGDILLHKGDPEGAEKLYKAAAVQHALEEEVSQQGARLALDKIRVATDMRAAQLARKARGGRGARPDLPRLDEAGLDDAIRKAKSGTPIAEESVNDVYEVVIDGKKYAAKHLKIDGDQTPEVIQRSAEAEAVASELADLFGVCVPPSTVRVVPDGAGGVKEAWVVTPWVEGAPLSSMSLGRILSEKQQYADHRVFSMILGDYDRHLDNYRIDEATGWLVALDAGMGHSQTHAEQALDEAVTHWYRRGAAHRPKTFAAEQSLVYQQMEPMVRKVEKLFAEQEDAIRARLLTAMKRVHPDEASAAAAADQAFRTMKERAGLLDGKLVDINKTRNGFPTDIEIPETGCLFRPERPARAA